MKTTQQGMMGNFISLHEVVKAVADRIEISDEEVDRRRLNRPRGESAFEAKIVRSQIKNVIAMSRAAGVLLEPLDRPPSRRPEWYDSSRGYAKWKDAVSDRGIDILIDLSRTESHLLRNDRFDQQLKSVGNGQELLPAHSIGFEIEELISHLKSAKVPHSLKLRKQTRRRSDESKPAPLMGRSATPHLAPPHLADLKESESLTDYLSRTLPPLVDPPEKISEASSLPLAGKNASQEGVSAPPETTEPPVAQPDLESTWTRFEEEWLDTRSVTDAGRVVRVALTNLTLEERVLFRLKDVQPCITELARTKSCKDLIKLTTNGGQWAFVHTTLVGINTDDICTRKNLAQILRRWKEAYLSFTRNTQRSQ